MKNFVGGISVIRRESYIKVKVIKIKATEQCQIEASIKLANNGVASLLSSHAQTKEGYQMFLQPEADAELICQRILDVLLPLSYDGITVERINC
jgi:hypothetical protein